MKTEVDFSTKVQNIQELIPPTEQSGVVACNPPYGLRLGQNVDSVYRCLGDRWRSHFSSHNWRLVFLCPNMRLAKMVDPSTIAKATFSQGVFEFTFVRFCRTQKRTFRQPDTLKPSFFQ